MKTIVLCRPERQIVLGVPVLFLVGTLCHFVYHLSGELFLVGLFVPVNESVWEHLKMVLWPTILWWSIFYAAAGRHQSIDAPAWFAGALGAVLSAQATIVLTF